MKRLRLASAVTLLAVAFSFMAATTASASAPTRAHANHVAIHKITHTFTIKRNGVAIAETCTGVADITKSSKYPGTITGLAWVQFCTPDPAVTCSQTADMQTQNVHTGVWDADGDGRTTHGCAGKADASTITKKCFATAELLSYRTEAIFVVVDSQGVPLDWSGHSGVLNVIRIC